MFTVQIYYLLLHPTSPHRILIISYSRGIFGTCTIRNLLPSQRTPQVLTLYIMANIKQTSSEQIFSNSVKRVPSWWVLLYWLGNRHQVGTLGFLTWMVCSLAVMKEVIRKRHYPVNAALISYRPIACIAGAYQLKLSEGRIPAIESAGGGGRSHS